MRSAFLILAAVSVSSVAVAVTEQVHQRAQQQDQIGQGLDRVVDMLPNHIEQTDHQQHQHDDAISAAPEGLM